MTFRIVQPPAQPRPDKKVRKVRWHLAFIASLECAVWSCASTPVQVCHVRLRDASRQKDEGTGLKPHDRYTLPLCWRHHQEQHRLTEPVFWEKAGIAPLDLCDALWDASGDRTKALELIDVASRLFPFERLD
jgi:hypothetical protein